MLLVGLLVRSPRVIRSEFAPAPEVLWKQQCVIYILGFATVLLVTNHARVPWVGKRGLRVRELFPWVALAGFCWAVVYLVGFMLFWKDLIYLEDELLRVQVIAAVPLAIYAMGATWLWIRAFVQAGDDDRLRREEFDSAFL
jgi:hypothetical protein